MTLEQQMAEALEGKFYAFDDVTGTVRDLNFNPPKEAKPDRDFIFIRTSSNTTNMATIIAIVSHHFQVSPRDLKCDRRTRFICRARQAAYYLGKKYTLLSFPRIGGALGGKDHTSVLHGCKVVEKGRKYYEPMLSRCIRDIEFELNSQNRPAVASRSDGAADGEGTQPVSVSPSAAIIPEPQPAIPPRGQLVQAAGEALAPVRANDPAAVISRVLS